MNMHDTIFREYDIRGKVGSEFVISETENLTKAIIAFLKTKKPHLNTVVVGMDGRTSSPAIKDEMIRALQGLGLEITFIGVCPSPVLYFALAEHGFDVGLMITASHNPKQYNGIKICLGTKTIWGKDIYAIREIYKSKKFDNSESVEKDLFHESDMIS